MKVGLVCVVTPPRPDPDRSATGPLAEQVHGIAVHLAAAGHEVDVWTRVSGPPADGPGPADGLPGAGPPAAGDGAVPGGAVRVHHLPAGPPAPLAEPDLGAYLPALGEALGARWEDPRERPAVVLAVSWSSGLVAQLAVRQLRLPVVQWFADLAPLRTPPTPESPGDQRLARLERSLAAAAVAVVAASSAVAAELVSRGLSRRRVRTVPPGVDTATFHRTGEHLLRSDRFRLVYAGGVGPRARVDLLVRALAGLPGVELVVAGGGEAPGAPDAGASGGGGHGGARPDGARPEAPGPLQRLQALARRVGVGDRLTLLGTVPRERMAALYRSADVVVDVPTWSGLGMAGLEAMACGRPLVAAATGALADHVVPGVTGLLVPPGRADSVAHVLRQARADSFSLHAMGHAAADRATIRYSWPRVAAELGEVLAAARPVGAPAG